MVKLDQLRSSDEGTNGLANDLVFRCKPADASVKAMRLQAHKSTQCQPDMAALCPGILRLAVLDTAELFDAAVILLDGDGVLTYCARRRSSIPRSLLAQY